MKAMQALQPQINALRSKHKSDPQRLQRETMELYRKHKVNPMGGCLPMVAQVPIFYALYLALSVSVELQSAPFSASGGSSASDLWICDLASQDPTYVLPILMGVTMFVQQKMTPVDGRSAPGQDDADHAVRLHVHVPQPAVGPRPLLDRVQRAADPPAVAHGSAQGARGSRGDAGRA